MKSSHCAKCDKKTFSARKGNYYVCVWCNTIKERAGIEIKKPDVPSVSIDNQKKLF